MKKIFQISIFSLLLVLGCAKEDISNSGNNSGNGNDSDNGDTTSANMQPTGTSANDLLSDVQFSQMVIELVYVDGFQPSQASITNFLEFLTERTFKPNGITVDMRSIASSGLANLSIADIQAIEDSNRTFYNTDDQIAVWAYFTDGASSETSSNGIVLGTAYRNTSFVIFEESIHSLSDSPLEPNRSLLESTVIRHEFGHLFGLTNLGTPLQSDHEDLDHPKHCNVESCLMYFATESGSGIDNLIGAGSPPQLDAQCIDDLQANGGK